MFIIESSFLLPMGWHVRGSSIAIDFDKDTYSLDFPFIEIDSPFHKKLIENIRWAYTCGYSIEDKSIEDILSMGPEDSVSYMIAFCVEVCRIERYIGGYRLRSIRNILPELEEFWNYKK